MILKAPDGRQFGLQAGENLIGRSADAAVRMDAPRVSRRHAIIEWDGQRARIMDLGSTNGTTINGRRLEPNRHYPLNPADQLDFGAGVFAVTEGAPAAASRAGSEPPPIVPISIPLPVPPEPPASRRSWPLIAGLAAVLIVVFAAAVWWGLSRTRTQQEAETIEPTAAVVSASEDAAAPEEVLPPTATLAPAKAVASKPKAPAAGSAPRVALPPINATTMPNLMQQFMAGADPNLIAAMLGGTPVPGLSNPLGGTPGAAGNPRAGRYPAPRLVAPATGSGYSGQDAVVVLEWEPTQGLRANDYYWVMVFYKRGEREEAGGAWMKGTNYRVPAWFLSQAQGRFEWQVVIAEATGLAEQGGALRGTVSDPSERRWFQWDAAASQPTAPAPDPGDSPLPTPTYGG